MDLEAQYDKLYRYCYFQCKDVQAAEDVVQETFLRWLEHYPGQKEREAIPTLYTIARNLCVDLARQRTHLPLRESDRQTPDPTGDWAEKWDLERVLARLPQEDQTLLLLRYANQVPVQALSKLTGLSRFAIYRKCAKLLLARLPQPTLSLGQFVGGQARYIQKQTWLLSLVVLVPVLWGTDLWITAALLPFLVPLAVSEGAKSTLYGMEELETASRFSRKSVLLARLCLIGTFHAVLLLALTLLLGGSQGLSLGRTGAYLLAPYLLTAWGSLWLSRRLRGREVLYGATALAVLASGSYSAAVFLADDLFALGALPWWSLAVALLAAALIGEGIAFAKRIKEDTWNLSFET